MARSDSATALTICNRRRPVGVAVSMPMFKMRSGGPRARVESRRSGEVFHEQTSSVGERKQLEAALDFAREGDTLVITKLDRLARSVVHLLELVERLQAKGVALADRL